MTERLTNLACPARRTAVERYGNGAGQQVPINRYLILAALGSKPVTLIGLLRSRDTDLMMGALRSPRCPLRRGFRNRHHRNGYSSCIRPIPWQRQCVLRTGRHGDAFRARPCPVCRWPSEF